MIAIPFRHVSVVISELSVASFKHLAIASWGFCLNMLYKLNIPEAMLNPRWMAKAIAKLETMARFLISAPTKLVRGEFRKLHWWWKQGAYPSTASAPRMVNMPEWIQRAISSAFSMGCIPIVRQLLAGCVDDFNILSWETWIQPNAATKEPPTIASSDKTLKQYQISYHS